MKNNKLEKIGDSIIINVVSQCRGNVKLTSFTDLLNNASSTRTYAREFRLSVDDLFWSDWEILTDSSLSNVSSFASTGYFTIQVRYTRTGTDTTGVIEFDNIQFIGHLETIPSEYPVIKNSIFSNIIDQPELYQLERNIFKKLYYRGILPQYITRAENLDIKEDKDFSDIWSSVAKFFGLLIRFFKRYENFNNDYSLLYEYLKQNGLYFDESSVTLEELQYLVRYFYDQIRQRGTAMVFKRKGTEINGNVLEIDGEFIRLIRSKPFDELLYEVIPLDKMGWCIGQSSPLYRGTSNSEFLNKTKENTADFQSFDNFFIGKTGTVNITLNAFDNKKTMLMIGQTFTAGLGRINDTENADDYLCVIDPRMDYEISFAFQLGTSVQAEESSLIFGVEGFDVLKNKMYDAFITPNGSEITGNFFIEKLTNKTRLIWYYVRGIIFSYYSIPLMESKTNLGYGTNLYFNNPFVRYILPKIQFTSTSNFNQTFRIWNYKIRPLVRGTSILPLKNKSYANSTSLGFIQSPKLFYSYVNNNNSSLSQNEVSEITNKYLLPYNLNSIFVYINEI